jgi:glycosyltransferase involved in cell wall biosynthesis
MVEGKKLNVIFFPAWFPTSENRLAGKFVVDHAKSINEFANVTVIYIDSSAHHESWFEYVESQKFGLSTKICRLRKFKGLLFFINYVLYGFSVLFLLFKERHFFKTSNINHVHVLTRTAILPYLLKLVHGTRYVISEHWSRYLLENDDYHGSIRKLVTRFLLKKSSGIAFVSNNLKLAMQKHKLSHANSRVIHNVLDVRIYQPSQRVNVNMLPNVLHVSGLNDDVKNVSGILRAKAILEGKGINFNLILIGDDEFEGPVIRGYAKQLHLNDVNFCGKLYGDELIGWYQKANVFVLNSNYDNQPYVLLEAMSCGVPVIATKVGGVPEMMTEKTGLLIPPKSDDLLAEAITKVINKNVSFNSLEIRKHVVANYSYQRVGKTILDFYRTALSN